LRLLDKVCSRYAIRIKSNPVLQRKIAHLLKRPVGRRSRQPKKFYGSFRYRAGRVGAAWYRAGSWTIERGRGTSHAKYLVFQLAEVAVPRPLFAAIVERIGRLRQTCASG
jgi:hypothetical protein